MSSKKVPRYIVFQLGKSFGAFPSHCITFNILIQKLIWIELRTIRRQVEQFNLVLVFLKPRLQYLGIMKLKIV